MDLLPVVVLEEPEKKPRRSGRKLLRGLLQRCSELLRQVMPLLPWLLCLLCVGACMDPRFQAEDAQTGRVALLAASLAFGCGVAGFGDVKPVLLAMLFWHGPRPVGDRWCRAALKDGSNIYLEEQAALGLVLLDDLLRTVLQFLASEPAEAWPFALTCRSLYQLSQDEEWWERCYRDTAWQRLPSAEPWLLSGPRRMLREALLLASMMAETAGMMVLLQPPAIGWAAAPCIASTLLVVSCSPWLPRQSNLVLVEMSRLMSLICKFAVYVQAVLLLLSTAAQSHLPLFGRRPGMADRFAFTLETAALAVMYFIIACRLIVNMARCRAASPLYAVPAEEVVPEPVPLNHSKPLYCNGGLVGAYAPTNVVNWEELSGISTRRRYILRRCGELLVSREAHLLSNLEALQMRINEAENDTVPHNEQLKSFPGQLALALCLLACADWSFGNATGQPCLQAFVWLLILSRLGRWYHEVLQNLPRQSAQDEVWDLRREFCTLHRHLAETQRLITQLEDRVQTLGVVPKSQRRGPGDVIAFGVTILAWFGCFCLVLLWQRV